MTQEELIQQLAIHIARQGDISGSVAFDQAAKLGPGLHRYIIGHIRPGSFLQVVLENNLRDSVLRADPVSRQVLYGLVSWLFEVAPMDSWGSEDAVASWLRARPVST